MSKLIPSYGHLQAQGCRILGWIKVGMVSAEFPMLLPTEDNVVTLYMGMLDTRRSRSWRLELTSMYVN